MSTPTAGQITRYAAAVAEESRAEAAWYATLAWPAYDPTGATPWIEPPIDATVAQSLGPSGITGR